MRWALVSSTTGCTLRVSSEPLAYAGVAPWAWRVLPVSAFIELSAVPVFSLNMMKTLATPIPTWFGRQQIKGTMMVFELSGYSAASD